jgi:hypothetical protein
MERGSDKNTMIEEEPLYAWQVYDTDNRWGIIAAEVEGLGKSPLVTRSWDVAEKLFGPFARAHSKQTGLSVRMARFELSEILEETFVPE